MQGIKGTAMTKEERRERQHVATQKYNASEKGMANRASYRVINHQKRLEQGAVYRAINKDVLAEKGAVYRAANMDKEVQRAKCYRIAHPEKTAEWAREEYKSHPEKSRAAAKSWKDANPESCRATNKKWRDANPERMRATRCEWERNHPEKAAVNARNHSCKHNAKRRTLGFNPLNSWFVGCEGHHVNPQDVIYMPKKLHCGTRHNQFTGQGMAQMNAVAYNFFFKQEVEALIPEATP